MMHSREQRSRTALYASLGAAAIGSILFITYTRQLEKEISGGSPIALLALREDVKAGQPIREEMLIVHEVPDRYVESRQVLASELSKVVGVRVAINLEANQTLAWTDLVSTPRDTRILSDNIPPGMRAMSIAHTQHHAFGGLLRPGDRVDVLVTKSIPGENGSLVTVPLLQNVLVLAVGDSMRAVDLDDRAHGAGVVTLLVSIDQAGLLTHAARDGTITIILRNQDDLELNEGLVETDDSHVLELEKRWRRQRRVVLERVD
jgi:pilus assembly protein CpaB